MLLTLAEWLLAALVLTASFFILAGAIGLTRFPDFYMRLHAPTKASTLGVGGLLIASMGMAVLQGQWHVSELLITLFIFITAPISTNLMAQAALHLALPSRAPLPAEARPAALHERQPDQAQSGQD